MIDIIFLDFVIDLVGTVDPPNNISSMTWVLVGYIFSSMLKIDHAESDELVSFNPWWIFEFRWTDLVQLNMQPTILVIDVILHLQFDIVYSIPSMVKFFSQLSGHAITTIRVEPIDENE